MNDLPAMNVWPNPLLPQEMSVDGPGEPWPDWYTSDMLRLYLAGLELRIFPPPQVYPRPDVSQMIAGFKVLAEHMAEHLVPAIEEMGRQAASLTESLAKWQNAYDTAREEDPLRRAIPKPSTTPPPMWAVRPGARRRRHHG